jgi:hypothetical protein
MRDLGYDICDYINKEWIATWEGSIRSFAQEHNVDEKTIRQIMRFKNSPFRVGLYTLEKMCEAREITLEWFFGQLKR